MSEPVAARSTDLIQQRLLNGVRAALLIVAVVVQFGLTFAPGVRRHGGPIGSVPEVIAFALFGLVAIVGMFFVARRQSLYSSVRWTGTAILLLSSVLVSAALPPDPVLRAQHWYFGLVGWYALYLLFDVSLAAITAVLAVHVAFSLFGVVVMGAASADLASMAISAVSVIGFQFGLGMAAGIVRRIALSATESARVEQSIQTAEATADVVHRDREEHYARLLTTVGPLLAGLATGELDPTAERTRRSCAIEAARMRRLFAESDDSSDRLIHELTASIDVAERHDISVQLAVRGEPRELSTEVRRELLEPISEVLSLATSSARVTVLRGPCRVRVSVVAEVASMPAFDVALRHVRLAKLVDGSPLWMETVWEARS